MEKKEILSQLRKVEDNIKKGKSKRVSIRMPRILTNPKMDKDLWRIHTVNDILQQNISEYNNRNGINPECQPIFYEGKEFNCYEATPELVLEIKRRISDVMNGGKETFIFHKKKRSGGQWIRWSWDKRS